jgi:hypothetical protein
LSSALRDQATHQAGQLPANVRGQFIAGFAHSQGNAIEAGGGSQTAVPKGVSASVASQVAHVAATVFQRGYVEAMHVTLILPIVAMLIGAAACFAVRRRPVVAASPANRANAGPEQGHGQGATTAIGSPTPS